MPADTAVAIPEVEPIVATGSVLLLHVPPGVVLLSVVVLQNEVTPVIGASGFTVSVTDATHPVITVYCIVVVPFDTPVTNPVTGSMVATVVLLLLHVPPVVALDRVVV